jgi:hypothetical protein
MVFAKISRAPSKKSREPQELFVEMVMSNSLMPGQAMLMQETSTHDRS